MLSLTFVIKLASINRPLLLKSPSPIKNCLPTEKWIYRNCPFQKCNNVLFDNVSLKEHLKSAVHGLDGCLPFYFLAKIKSYLAEPNISYDKFAKGMNRHVSLAKLNHACKSKKFRNDFFKKGSDNDVHEINFSH